MSEQQNLAINIDTDRQIDSVEEYQFEPIKGYPMLNWKGKRPFTSTQYYPAQLKERHGEPVGDWINKIYWGDNLQVMSHLLKEYRGKVSLVYIDPPFDSKADYKKKISLQGKLVTNDQNSFEEKQYTDIWTNDEYLQFMYERLILIRELLADDGSIYVHCDYRKSHRLRCLLDEVFGENNCLNEVIWEYRTDRTGGVSDNFFARKHDVISFYSKTNQYKFNLLKEKTYIPTLANRTFAIEELGAKKDEEGCPNCSLKGQWYKMSNMRDVWAVTPLFRNSQEKEGYPTQKPEALLERIIQASSNPGDIIFDCFMGSGTTQAVAMKLGRRFIGADINLGAIEITTKRLLGIAKDLNEKQQQIELDLNDDEEPTTYYTGFEVYNINHYDVFRNPLEAKDLLLEALEVQKLEQGSLFDGERDGRMIKVMPVNRIATRSDLNELIAGFDYKAFERRQEEHPNKPVEKVTLVCMGHEPGLADRLKAEVLPYQLDVEVVDILRDRQDIQFKRDSEAKVVVEGKNLVIEAFYPMNLLQKLSLQKENVEDWRELVESIMVDWNYDGAILEPSITDIPDKKELVKGSYPIPEDAGTIRIKITDLLSESLEIEVKHG